MISYAEIQFDQPAWIQHTPATQDEIQYYMVNPNTECNYLVMFFVIGVFAMAFIDGMRKQSSS
jgi:hypothetical protein